jgi:K+-sensing histidine kinase KdpD
VVVVYVIVVALTAAIGGRTAGLASSLSAALAYNYFFTTPYQTLRIDSWEQVATVVLLFVAGLLASLGGGPAVGPRWRPARRRPPCSC